MPPPTNTVDKVPAKTSATTLSIKNSLESLSKAYINMAEYIETERNRVLNMQTYVGEAVTYELLNQSYGIPEYTPEDKLNRLLSCILQAVGQYRKDCEDRKNDDLSSGILGNLWDPHNIEAIEPNPSTIRIREIKTGTTEKPCLCGRVERLIREPIPTKQKKKKKK